MDKIYYQPNHLWKGQKAVKKLKEYSKEKPKVIKQWLSRQAFWQVHLPAPKRVDRPHYQVTISNEMHQFDCLYMPSDTLYGNKYKYIPAGEIRTWGFWCSFRPLLHHTSSAHNSHSAPELISLLNCIKLWGKLVLVQYDANIWC